MDFGDGSDRGEQFEGFHHFDSLQAYLLVSQDRPLVDVFPRATDWGSELRVAAVCEDVER